MITNKVIGRQNEQKRFCPLEQNHTKTASLLSIRPT